MPKGSSAALKNDKMNGECHPDALITPDKKVQQQNMSNGSSSRRLFANDCKQKDVTAIQEDSEEVQSRKRPCECSCSCSEAPLCSSRAGISLGRDHAKRQATRRLFGGSPTAEQLESYFRAAEEQVCDLHVRAPNLCMWSVLGELLILGWVSSKQDVDILRLSSEVKSIAPLPPRV
jgi:hypothetical protein